MIYFLYTIGVCSDVGDNSSLFLNNKKPNILRPISQMKITIDNINAVNHLSYIYLFTISVIGL